MSKLQFLEHIMIRKFKFLFIIVLAPLLATGQSNFSSMNIILKGTTIITSITNDKIIIAADSKQTWGGDSSQKDFKIPLKCKIRHIGNFFFAAEGHTTMITPHIDFLELIEEMDFKASLTFSEKIDSIEFMLREPVKIFVENFQRYNDKAFKAILNKVLLSISFSCFENEKPVSEALFWEIKSTLTGWEIIPTHAKSDLIPRYMIQGQKAAIDSYLTNPLLANEIFDEKNIPKLIELQIKSTPLLVGLPIDIVVLNSKGYNWIQKKEGCK